ncbi:MAG TPA: response regulator transcription factor [Acetobacteraceae bacterium]|jgi:DNA-binding response OmpR family regulator|nr:response regulator transcription factor [Acetobacteraceae bacterium]
MPNRRPVLIVEDDETLRTMVTEYLDDTGEFVVTTAPDIEAADRILADEDAHFDAIILDIGLPDGDGRDYCARLRRNGHSMPIIMLTGAIEETDIVRGLDSGAVDYIAKPFRAAELLARLRAQLRVFDRSEQVVFPVGPYTFRPAKKLLHDPAKNRRIRLTDKETAVLKFLYRSDSAVNRQILMHEVWGYNSTVTTHTLETHIYRLRQKIEADPANPSLLVTEGGGYRLRPEPAPVAHW